MGASVFFAAASELTTLTNTFLVNGVATDPTTVTLTVTDPTGTATSYTYGGGTVTKDSTGVYHKDVDVSATAGEWTYQWIGTGTVSDDQIGTWLVQESALGRLYASVDALKSRLGMSLSATTDDFELHGACFAASRHVENVCERFFFRTTSADVRTFIAPPPLQQNPLWLGQTNYLPLPEFCDLVSVTTLKTDASGDGVFETTWQTSDYQLLPINATGCPEPLPYTALRACGTLLFPVPLNYQWLQRQDRVQITGVFGWPKVPAAVRQATLIKAAELFKLKDAPFGVAGFGDMGVVRVKDNPVMDALLSPYKRNPILVG